MTKKIIRDPLYQMNDKEFIEWVAQRLQVMFGEPSNVDYIQRLIQISKNSPKEWIIDYPEIGIKNGKIIDEPEEKVKSPTKQTPDHLKAEQEDSKLFDEITTLIDHNYLIKACALIPNLKTNKYKVKSKYYLKSSTNGE